ncbi:hypothetical protein J2X29_002583 [Shewanella putrefaciens]|nr:hypothetical protein [Shewanella putrefaciens]
MMKKRSYSGFEDKKKRMHCGIRCLLLDIFWWYPKKVKKYFGIFRGQINMTLSLIFK